METYLLAMKYSPATFWIGLIVAAACLLGFIFWACLVTMGTDRQMSGKTYHLESATP